MEKPIIGITALYRNEHALDSHCTRAAYVTALQRAGAEVVLLPVSGPEACAPLVARLDGILIPGGPDANPLTYGEQPIPEVTCMRMRDDLFEYGLIKAAAARHIPVFAVCRGIQVLNVALGGTLYQDLKAQNAATISHYQDLSVRSEGTHRITVSPNTHLHDILGSDTAVVNSFHHQAVKDLGEGLLVSALSDDRVVEAVESPDGYLLGVQWHPEHMTAEPQFFRLFERFVERSKKQHI